MKLPVRPETHIVEAESWRLLQSLAPKEWIVREVSERDYGIDCYIERTTEDGHINGDLMSVQLKGTKKVKWKKVSAKNIQQARSPSIKTSTVNYWLGLPVPVFLFVADLSKGDIYYVPVKDKIRAQYGSLETQDTISFPLLDELSLKSVAGKALLPWFYARERAHEQFTFHIANLLSHIDMFIEFIQMNQNLDSFMEVETDSHLHFRALYQTCQMASLYLENEWKVDSLSSLCRKDQEQWKDPYCYLHESTLDYALQKIEGVFPGLVRKALKLVTETQYSYWLRKDRVFFDLCNDGGLISAVERLEQQIEVAKR